MSLNDTIDIIERVDAKIDILIEQRDRAIYALRRYGKHDRNCALDKSLRVTSSTLDRCTCGLKAALESLR